MFGLGRRKKKDVLLRLPVQTITHLCKCRVNSSPHMPAHNKQAAEIYGLLARYVLRWLGAGGRRQFRPAIEGCYYNDGEAITRFVFELTKPEAKRLMELFEKQPAAKAPQPRALPPAGARTGSAKSSPGGKATARPGSPATAPAGPDAVRRVKLQLGDIKAPSLENPASCTLKDPVGFGESCGGHDAVRTSGIESRIWRGGPSCD